MKISLISKPNNASYLVALADCHNFFNLLCDAVKVYKRALIFELNECEIFFKLATLSKGRGNLDIAINYYKEALHSNPIDFSIYNNLGICNFELDDSQRSSGKLQKAISIRPDYDLAQGNIAAVGEIRSIEFAIECFKNILH